MSGVPDGARRTSRTSEHASLDRDQRRRRALVPDQRLARSAPATDRDAAASSQGRPASPQPDRRRDPDQWRDRRGRRPAVDARGLALHALCPSAGACDPRIQQHLQCAEREEREAAGRSRSTRRSSPPCPTARPPASRSCPSRFPARAPGISKARRTRPAAKAPAIRSGFGSWTRQAANISISSPPARG